MGRKVKNVRIILIILLLVPSWYSWSQSYTIMTLNIRYDNPDDGPDRWDNRRQDMISFVESQNPNIFGIQEGLQHQVEFLDNQLKDYSYFGVGRDDGFTKGEYCAVFYHHDKFKILKSGTFWLSETPDKVSVGWDASMERICTYGLFQDIQTKQEFWVLNTHFDHRGPQARQKSAELAIEKIKELVPEKQTVVLMGDFNATPKQPPIKIVRAFMDDAQLLAGTKISGPEGTSNGFKGVTQNRRIDYIFTINAKIKYYKHIDARTSKNRNLSDHLPVLTEITIP